jgi:hypothetical protein
MNPTHVLVRTPKGIDEMQTRRNKLDQKLRALLIMVNGKATAAEIAGQFGGLGNMETLLNRLILEGYVNEQ